MKDQDLACGQGEVEIRTLRDDSNQALDRDLILPDFVLADPCLAAGGLHARGENSDGRGFARAVGTEQTKDFAGGDVEREAVERDNFRLGLLSFA